MDITNIPAVMRKHPNWVAYRLETRKGKQTKVPYQAKDPDEYASTTNPDTWCDIDDALEGLSTGVFSGLGFVFNKKAGLVGIDIDKCIDEDGVLAPHAIDWVKRCDSYTEISPSRTGLHIILEGELDGKGQKRSLGEIYDDGRFFTVTGNYWDTLKDVKRNPEAIRYVAKQISDEGKPQAELSVVKTEPVTYVDHELVKLFCADMGSNELWNKRQKRPFSSQSEYDMAIANIAVIRGFSNDAVGELIYQHRLFWNDSPEKGRDLAYIHRTLITALQQARNPEPEPNKSYFTDFADMVANPSYLKWVVRDYFPERGIVWLFGRYSSNKSFVMLDIAYHIINGMQWCGNDVTAGKVICVAGEGGLGIKQRMAGLAQHYDLKPQQNMLKFTPHSVFINDPSQMAELRVNIRAIAGNDDLAMIIIDTKAANMQGSDSDPATMNDWINELRRVEIEFNTVVVVVDHVGHGEQDRMRGASQQAGAADAAYRIDKCEETGRVTLSTYKDPKDFKAPTDINFYPEVIQLSPAWNDDRGERATTLIMNQTTPAPAVNPQDYSASSGRISANQTQAAEILKRLWFYYKGLVANGDQHLRIERREWVAECKKTLGKNASAVCASAIKNGLVLEDGDVHIKPIL